MYNLGKGNPQEERSITSSLSFGKKGGGKKIKGVVLPEEEIVIHIDPPPTTALSVRKSDDHEPIDFSKKPKSKDNKKKK